MRLPVRAPMYAAVQIDKPILQPRLVIEPCHAIHPGRNLRAECTSRIQRVKRLVRVASRPEPVREAPEVGLINLIEHGHNGPVEQSCAPMPRCLTDVAARQPCGVQKKPRTGYSMPTYAATGGTSYVVEVSGGSPTGNNCGPSSINGFLVHVVSDGHPYRNHFVLKTLLRRNSSLPA